MIIKDFTTKVFYEVSLFLFSYDVIFSFLFSLYSDLNFSCLPDFFKIINLKLMSYLISHSLYMTVWGKEKIRLD